MKKVLIGLGIIAIVIIGICISDIIKIKKSPDDCCQCGCSGDVCPAVCCSCAKTIIIPADFF